MSGHRGNPELLAPAGDWDALRSACANGADAIYFGLSAFNARHRAANFTLDELPRVLDFLHSRNVRGFVTLNTLIFSDELDEAARFVRRVAECGADAVIVQDLGLARLIAAMAPGLAVHASTQMTLTEPRGVEWARDRLNIQRAVLARELSVADVRKVADGTSVPVEVFVHGALCVAYSGQCLTSEALGGRSANRGQCAQACRLPYEMLVDGERRDLGDRAYLLSPQDLAGHDFVGDLIEAGVVSFKIEGRLKGPHYVAAATKTYRDAIDAAVGHRPFVITEQQDRDLRQTFSRGFTPGFLEGPNHQRLVRGRVPKSRGICVGTVTATSRKGIRVAMTEAPSILAPGDGVVFDLGRPEEREPGGRIWRVREFLVGPGRFELELAFEPGAIDFAAIPTGCSLWKTDDPAMRKRLEQGYAGDPIARRSVVSMTLTAELGGPIRLAVRDEAGRTGEADWRGPLEAARKHPATEASIRDQLARLGDTPFELAGLDCQIPPNAMIPRSVLNDLRRRAIEMLRAQREAARRIEVVLPNVLAAVRRAIAGEAVTLPAGRRAERHEPPGPDHFLDACGGRTEATDSTVPIPGGSCRSIEIGVASRDDDPKLTVLVRTLEQLEAVLEQRPAMVYCEFEDVRRYKEAVPLARSAGIPIGLATLRILKPGEEGYLKPIAQAEPDTVLVRNLTAMLYYREAAPRLEQVGDFSLNVANELTADLLMREGFSRLVPSYDLSWEQFAALVRRSHAEWYEPVIHQRMPMFHMEHCVFAAFLSNGKDWRDCGRPCDKHRVDLRDRVGADFPVTPDAGCRNTVFNSVPQSAAEYLPQMLALGLRRFRVELLRESPAEIGPLLAAYRAILSGADNGRETWRKLRAMNQLGVTRGTLQLV